MKTAIATIIAVCSAAAAVAIAQAGQDAYVSDMAQAMPALKHGPVLHQADVDRLLRPQEIRLAPMEIVVEAPGVWECERGIARCSAPVLLGRKPRKGPHGQL